MTSVILFEKYTSFGCCPAEVGITINYIQIGNARTTDTLWQKGFKG